MEHPGISERRLAGFAIMEASALAASAKQRVARTRARETWCHC